MKLKKSQLITIWLLPLIVVGGFFNPYLGYLVIAMMVFLLALSFFKGRYWCWNLCPRGAFLDGVISNVSLKKKVPGFFVNYWFRLLVFIGFMGFLVFRLVKMGESLAKIGTIFVSMCALTTVIVIILGVLYKPRGWCMMCPMGFLQERIHGINKKSNTHGGNQPR